jgi:hypothetical protein
MAINISGMGLGSGAAPASFRIILGHINGHDYSMFMVNNMVRISVRVGVSVKVRVGVGFGLTVRVRGQVQC